VVRHEQADDTEGERITISIQFKIRRIIQRLSTTTQAWVKRFEQLAIVTGRNDLRSATAG
jgi:hypothetical protein